MQYRDNTDLSLKASVHSRWRRLVWAEFRLDCFRFKFVFLLSPLDHFKTILKFVCLLPSGLKKKKKTDHLLFALKLFVHLAWCCLLAIRQLWQVDVLKMHLRPLLRLLLSGFSVSIAFVFVISVLLQHNVGHIATKSASFMSFTCFFFFFFLNESQLVLNCPSLSSAGGACERGSPWPTTFCVWPSALWPRTMSWSRASPPSRVGPLNGRKLSHQYLLCKRLGSAGVNRTGASAALSLSSSQRRQSAVPPQPASPQCPPTTILPQPPPSFFFFFFFFSPHPEQLPPQADSLGPQTVVFDLIASSARELVPSDSSKTMQSRYSLNGTAAMTSAAPSHPLYTSGL